MNRTLKVGGGIDCMTRGTRQDSKYKSQRSHDYTIQLAAEHEVQLT